MYYNINELKPNARAEAIKECALLLELESLEGSNVTCAVTNSYVLSEIQARGTEFYADGTPVFF